MDCIEIERFENLKEDPKFLSRVFTDREINYCKSNGKPSQHFAARFAGKEAVIKALSSFDVRIEFLQIEIRNDKDGKPFVNLLAPNTKKFLAKISMSHSETVAIAFVIICEHSRI